jgi:surface antigen
MNSRRITATALFWISLSAYGAIGADLRGLPGNFASDADRQILRDAITGALETSADNVTTDWNNPATGSNGVIRPVSSYEMNGMPCRKLQLINNFDDQHNKWQFSFCKTPEGVWKVAQ